MAAGKYDFAIEQGTSYKLSLIYKDSNGTPVNLTGWCARLTWKTNLGITQTFSSTNIDTALYSFTINGPEAKITLIFPASITNNFDFSSAKYDLELQGPDSVYAGGGKYTTRILFGTITISKRFSESDSHLSCII
jgi:hypothetical protein